MVLASALYSSGGGGIPTGDKFRLGTQVTLSGATTVINLTSTSGTLWGFIIRHSQPAGGNGAGTVSLDSVTVDGAATRTFNTVIQAVRWAADTVATWPMSEMVSIPIKFASSLQAVMSASNPPGSVFIVPVYSVD